MNNMQKYEVCSNSFITVKDIAAMWNCTERNVRNKVNEYNRRANPKARCKKCKYVDGAYDRDDFIKAFNLESAYQRWKEEYYYTLSLKH